MAPEPAPDLELRPSAALERAVGERYGLSLRECTPEGLAERLRFRIHERALDGVESYAEYLLYSGDLSAWHDLVETLTANESRVFGTPSDFAPLLELTQDPRWSRFARPGAGTFRCLSAGCGTGEEAYSLAIALGETRARAPAFDFEVIGVDVSARAVARARAAVYPAARAATVPGDLRERYLLERDGDVSAEPLRPFVRFGQVNLCAPGALDTLGSFELVFARGFLHAMTVEGRRRALANLTRALAPGGVLVLDAGQSAGDLDLGLIPVRWSDRHAYELPLGEEAEDEPAGPSPLEPPEPGTALVAHRSAIVRSWMRILLEQRGLKVEEAPDAVRVLERAARGRPRERYFLELTLPSQGGLWAGSRLRRIGAATAESLVYLSPRGAAAETEDAGIRLMPLPLSARDLES